MNLREQAPEWLEGCVDALHMVGVIVRYRGAWCIHLARLSAISTALDEKPEQKEPAPIFGKLLRTNCVSWPNEFNELVESVVEDWFRPERYPDNPTTAKAGSPEKIEVLRRRVAEDMEIHHPEDNRQVFKVQGFFGAERRSGENVRTKELEDRVRQLWAQGVEVKAIMLRIGNK